VSELASRLRSYPGDDPALAIGAAAFAVATLLAFIRMQGSWAAFPLLLLVAIPCAALFAVALLPGQQGNPIAAGPDGRLAPWQTVCVLFAIPLFAISILELFHVLGKDSPGTGTVTWVLILTGLGAAAVSVRLKSPGATVLASVAFAAAALTAINWVDSSAKLATYRDIVLVVGLAFLLVARLLFAENREHAKQLVAVGGLGLIAGAAVGNSGAFAQALLGFDLFPIEGKAGWVLLLIVVVLGLFAFAAWQRHGGSAFIGLIGLYYFVVFTGAGGDLSGWPLLLLLAAVACFAWALVMRPSRGTGATPVAQTPTAPPT
jgi:hypothetical protein